MTSRQTSNDFGEAQGPLPPLPPRPNSAKCDVRAAQTDRVLAIVYVSCVQDCKEKRIHASAVVESSGSCTLQSRAHQA